MSFKAEIGIIGAMMPEVQALIASLKDSNMETFSGIEFYTGALEGKKVVVAKCGVGKVFAAICAEAMILKYSPELLINTGVGGATDRSLKTLDVVFADRLLQYDMDTSAIGDPVGLISGINKVYFECDKRATLLLCDIAKSLSVNYKVATVATADKFVATKEEKLTVAERFGASACEMEGGAIAHAAYVNGVKFVVVRAISDSVEGDSSMEYAEFVNAAADVSAKIVAELISRW